MRKDPIFLTALIALGAVLSALALTELSYWLYGKGVGIHPFIVVNTMILAATLSPIFGYPWVRQTMRLRATRAELEGLARTDPLTGLPNRRAFFEFADAVFALPRQPVDHAVLMIDLDNFKSINDSLGHAAGDRVLVDIANAIRSAIDRTFGGKSMVARIGGEEFAALVAYHSSDRVLEMADSICAQVRQSVVPRQEEHVTTTVSVGIAFCLPKTTTDAALKVADKALYRAKGAGRDRWRAIAEGGTREMMRGPRPLVLVRDPDRAA